MGFMAAEKETGNPVLQQLVDITQPMPKMLVALYIQLAIFMVYSGARVYINPRLGGTAGSETFQAWEYPVLFS